MSDFRTIEGFEEVWRPVAGTRFLATSTTIRPTPSGQGAVRARLARIAAHAPEVVVNVTGRSRETSHLLRHLNYISRDGELIVEDRDGHALVGRAAMRELAGDWSAEARAERRRVDSPISRSLVLSMPWPTDPAIVHDAARAFAREALGRTFDYVFVLHTDTRHPHVHLTVRAPGEGGERLGPGKAELDAWRQHFAQALRDRGVEAEATPRRARGVTRKAEHPSLRRIRIRHEAGQGDVARNIRAAYHEAAKAAFLGETAPTRFEQQTLERQARIRGLYLAQAKLLRQSIDLQDQELGRKVEDFVRSMPDPDSQRLAFARELRAAAERARSQDERLRQPTFTPPRDRER